MKGISSVLKRWRANCIYANLWHRREEVRKENGNTDEQEPRFATRRLRQPLRRKEIPRIESQREKDETERSWARRTVKPPEDGSPNARARGEARG